MKFTSFEEMLTRNLHDYADKPAFRYEKDGSCVTVTHAEFFADVTNRKKYFLDLPLGAVGLYRAYTYEWIRDIFASVLAGRQTVLIDPSVEGALLQKIALYADIANFVTDDTTADEVAALQLSPVRVPTAQGEGYLLFFTSGTTGASKAVVLTSKSLCASAWNGNDKLTCRPDDNLLALLPLSHVFGFVCSMMWPLSQGACVSVGRGMRHLHDRRLRFLPSDGDFRGAVFACFLACQTGSQPRTARRFGGRRSCGRQNTCRRYRRRVRSAFRLRAYGNFQRRGHMTVCHDSKITLAEDGEILIYCPECMMQGYYKMPEATAAVLKDGVLSTGDLGSFDRDGKLHITGRKKDILVLPNGNKIYLPEWEQELQAAFGGNETAITMKDGVVTAIVVDKSGNADVAALKAVLDEFNRSKPFDMQVTSLCVTESPLPRTATGKIKRWML